MRHLNKHNHLGRTSSHRKALFSNMSASLIMHKRINTTVAKAKALKIYVEPIITKSKEDTTHSRRMAFSYLQDKDAVMELFRVIAPKIATRPGGYTRILKTGARAGDNSNMCFIELVDFNDTYAGIENKTEETKAKGTTRRSRKKGGATDKAVKTAEAAE
ncbi:MAG TPA: 50S ribosomal protein L17 [Bacteroidia bacterium]|jgi:large subunit ribosomal protein L17|nr:50S ribosomal protein L17 [Bacteroidia bacterium]